MLSFLTRAASDETSRITSSAWVMKLKDEIGEPDQLHSSIFDDTDGESADSDSSDDESRMPSLAHTEVSAAGVTTDRISSMGSVLDAGGFILAGTDRKQSWEHQLRDSSLAYLDLQRASTMDHSQELAAQPSRKRNARNAAAPTKRPRNDPPRRPPSPVNDAEEETVDVLEEDIRDDDILGGRGGLSNHHVGNKWFRQIVAKMKSMYRGTGAKTDKTALSRAIVEYVHAKKGRFLIRKPVGQDGWRTMTTKEARKKTSQALRETKALKWTLPTTEKTTQGTIVEV